MAFLRTITFFRSMSTTQLTWIAQQLEPVAWSRGAVLAEQGQRPTHLLLLRSGEARLSVSLQKLVVDVAVIALNGELLCESALDDSGNLGTYTAGSRVEGYASPPGISLDRLAGSGQSYCIVVARYRIHKKEARKLIRNAALSAIKESQRQRQEFVRARIVYVATFRPGGAAGRRGEEPKARLARKGAEPTGSEEISQRFGPGSLAAEALQRRHTLEKTSRDLLSRSRRGSSGGSSRSSWSGMSTVLSDNSSMSSVSSWTSSTRGHGVDAEPEGRSSRRSRSRRSRSRRRRDDPRQLVSAVGSHSAHAAGLFTRVDGAGESSTDSVRYGAGPSMISRDHDDSANSGRGSRSTGRPTSSSGRRPSSAKRRDEPSVFGSFSLDAFQPPRTQRAWT